MLIDKEKCPGLTGENELFLHAVQIRHDNWSLC